MITKLILREIKKPYSSAFVATKFTHIVLANGTQGGLADITAKALDGNLCSGSFNGTQQMNDWLRQHYKDDNVYACLAHRANEIVINGNKQWGTVLMSAYPTHDRRALITQLFLLILTACFIAI